VGVAVLVASCSRTMKFLYSFSMSSGSFSLVASFVLISIISLKSSKLDLELWRMGLGSLVQLMCLLLL
jgi:hypothetical protein